MPMPPGLTTREFVLEKVRKETQTIIKNSHQIKFSIKGYKRLYAPINSTLHDFFLGFLKTQDAFMTKIQKTFLYCNCQQITENEMECFKHASAYKNYV